ncbi:hypothetical protein MAR_000263 [Mya arenaria]|uniref:Antifreeze protein n=1 Tax=Mya arenaria TaxID=6604 RepID=A0ABY7F892_MYAAR|nr:hypothetical protein MAR_000263 [Mya arenaria]
MNGNLLLVVCLSTLRKLVADIGTPCTVTSDCNTTTVAGTVCDTIMSPPVCKLGSAANCTNNQDDCASNSSCIANACRCTVFTHTEETSTKLCKKDIGQTCAGLTDCLGTACSSTLACDRTANTGVVCDNTNVCKLHEISSR